MQTKEQIEQAFREELQALLDKYGAELEAKYHWQGYAECGEDVRMTVTIQGRWPRTRRPKRLIRSGIAAAVTAPAATNAESATNEHR